MKKIIAQHIALSYRMLFKYSLHYDFIKPVETTPLKLH